MNMEFPGFSHQKMVVKLGLQGMINQMLEECDLLQHQKVNYEEHLKQLSTENPEVLANLITFAEEAHQTER